jgi:hypothetical protein
MRLRGSNHKMIQLRAMRSFRSFPLLFLGLALPVMASDRTPPPITPATQFPAVEVHDKEKVAIAIEPYNTKEQEKLFHVEYTKYGVIPVRLIVTNLGDRPISLRDARILFEPATGDRIQAAEPEDVERRMNPHQPHGAMPTPTPFPIPGIHPRRKNSNDKNVEEDFDTFEYQALVVEPHTTRAGFLFYIVGDSADPLTGAHMSVTKLRDADGEELFYFDIPFDKYLKASNSTQ